MTIERLRNARSATPFRPFTIHLADGRSFPGPHPDFISQSPAGRTIIVFGQGEEEFSILDSLLVTEIEMHRASRGRR